MAQATSVVLKDGQTTPVNVTFSPERITPDLSVFTDRGTPAAIGYRRVKLSNRFAGGKSVVNRANMDIEYPVLATDALGNISRAYVLRASVQLILPDRATDQERKNLYAFLLSALQETTLRGALRDLDPLY